MTSSTKRKYVTKESLNYDSCSVEANQTLVRVKGPRGNHLYEVETEKQEEFLVSMPTKFRNTIWIKTGSYVVVEPIEEGNKVKGEIVKILTKEHIKMMKKDGTWPLQFTDERKDDYIDLPDDD